MKTGELTKFEANGSPKFEDEVGFATPDGTTCDLKPPRVGSLSLTAIMC